MNDPDPRSPVRLAELVATLSLGTDLGLGQPMEHVLRQCLIALRLGERSSKVVADIDQALLRIEEGSYGICARCSQPIDERRLEAVPTARYDAACQAIIESQNGEDDLPTL